MIPQVLIRIAVGPMAVFMAVSVCGPSHASGQDDGKSSLPRSPIEKPVPAELEAAKAPDTREAEIDRMIAVYDLRPHPAPAIPDNPPPHEGAMITLAPHVLEPPDLMLVEVLEALPGRPISGERLVRPDGTITLGFYGDVKVAGLTLEQAKVAIIKHLRKCLTDEDLGLEEAVDNGNPAGDEAPMKRPPVEGDRHPAETGKMKTRSSSFRPRAAAESVGTNRAAPRERRRSRVIRSASRQEPPQHPPAQREPVTGANQLNIPLLGPSRVTIKIEVEGQGLPAADQEPVAPRNLEKTDTREWKLIRPEDSQTVFVDVTSYSSKYYYILGDVLITGRNAYTGKETVLDALQFAGNLLPTAEPKNIRLVRPGVGGKPPKVYMVDLAAIQERGEVATNYQIFPGDRIIVGRNEVVTKTVEIDRFVAPIHSITAAVLQEAFMLRALQYATSEDRNQLLKEYVDFFAKEMSRPGGVKFDEQTLRDAFTRKMKLPPNPLAPAPTTPNPSPR